MKKHRKLYQKYIRNECDYSDDERMSAALEEFHLEDNENESLQDFDGDVDEDLSERLLSNVQYEIIDRRKIRRHRVVRVFGAILVFGLIIGLTRHNKRQAKLLSTGTFADKKTIVANNSDTTLVLNLPDQSIVQLMPHSNISYNANFNGPQRNIFLDGGAIFKVSKDPTKPFNVYSGKIVTTAIGTKFKVAEYDKNIFVKLLEGKIVVRRNNQHSDRHFLTAGNSINYNTQTDLFTSIMRTAQVRYKKQGEIPTTKNVNTSSTFIQLDNEPLADALDLLAQKYGVEIEYSPLDIDSINIIATVDKSKPIYKVLHNIAMMNNLTLLEIADKQYIMQKGE